MTRSQQILNKYQFSTETLSKVALKKTEKGIITELSTIHAVKEALGDSAAVFNRLFEVMRKKCGDRCICGRLISKNYRQISLYKFKCKCGIAINPLSRTPLRRTHKPLNQIILFIHQLYQSKRGLETTVIARNLGWKYKGSLSVRRRAMSWMKLALDNMNFLPGHPIELDEVYVRIPTGMGRNVKYSRGPNSERLKGTFVTTQQDTCITKAYVLEEAKPVEILPIINQIVPFGSTVYTDSSKIYNSLKIDYIHEKCNHLTHQWVIGDAHVNTAECYNEKFKTQIHRIHKGVSEHRLPEYASEISFRFSTRFKDFYEVLDCLLESLPPLFEINNK